MVHQFSKLSVARLSTCHKDLIKVMNHAIGLSSVDFGIAEGHRPLVKQRQYFLENKSKVDGITVKSKHQSLPSLAVDIYGWVNNKTCYDPDVMTFLAGVIMAAATDLFNRGEITHRLRWGGNWDNDGEIVSDQLFDDLPHFELLKV